MLILNHAINMSHTPFIWGPQFKFLHTLEHLLIDHTIEITHIMTHYSFNFFLGACAWVLVPSNVIRIVHISFT